MEHVRQLDTCHSCQLELDCGITLAFTIYPLSINANNAQAFLTLWLKSNNELLLALDARVRVD
jgi:hypothetical protein